MKFLSVYTRPAPPSLVVSYRGAHVYHPHHLRFRVHGCMPLDSLPPPSAPPRVLAASRVRLTSLPGRVGFTRPGEQSHTYNVHLACNGFTEETTMSSEEVLHQLRSLEASAAVRVISAWLGERSLHGVLESLNEAVLSDPALNPHQGGMG